MNCYRQLEEILRQNPEAATGIMPRRGEEPGAIDAAAWTGVCSVMLNLHEFITRD